MGSVCTTEYPCRELSDDAYTCDGQFADWAPASSDSAFKNNADGSVLDSRTALVWQRDLPSSYAPVCSGQYGTGSAAGDACSFDEASRYCQTLLLSGGGWRVPTKAELESLIDDSRLGPAIFPSFTGAPSHSFWTASLVAQNSGRAWSVDFNDGMSNPIATANYYRVRCVRQD